MDAVSATLQRRRQHNRRWPPRPIATVDRPWVQRHGKAEPARPQATSRTVRPPEHGNDLGGPPPLHHRRAAEAIISKPIDYDSPRRPAIELEDNDLDELKTRTAAAQSPQADVDEAEAAVSFELPGADLSEEELTVAVVPMQAGEFRCARCFLVHHRSQLVTKRDGREVCQECS
ncbi:MAG: DUF4193 domain-containing protein [Dactylosporangium sp.]|nr:DUF4193 domain-containing protein [Dactylosporangium sp.]NNJ60921.1 DUF4193 domain-containing protein [Dactylosporangium sp.]